MKRGALHHLLLCGTLLTSLGGSVPMAEAFQNEPIQGLHQEISSQMEELEPTILPNVDRLWRGTVMRSATLQLALQKMAEKTGKISTKDTGKKDWTSRMLRSAIQFGGMGGAIVTGSAAPLVGSAFLGRITQPNQIPQRLTEVTSADLVILAKEIEQAQSDLLLTYLRYRQSKETVSAFQTQVDAWQNSSTQGAEDSLLYADMVNTFVLNQSQKLRAARADMAKYRNLLVLAAGEDSVKEVDQPGGAKPLPEPPSDQGQSHE